MRSLQQTDAGLLIKLKAMWRTLKSEKFPIPITAFEVQPTFLFGINFQYLQISLHDLTENRLIEVRTASISSPLEGIRKVSETVSSLANIKSETKIAQADFFTLFSASLDFGHEYEIEVRLISFFFKRSTIFQ